MNTALYFTYGSMAVMALGIILLFIGARKQSQPMARTAIVGVVTFVVGCICLTISTVYQYFTSVLL